MHSHVICAAVLAAGTAVFACGSGSETRSAFPGGDSSVPTSDGGGLFVSNDGGTSMTDAALQSGCATGKTGTRRLPGYIQLVLDGSGSMQGAKYAALQEAVNAVTAKWLSEADPSFGVGVSIFSDSKDPTGGRGPYPSGRDVSIGIVDSAQAAAIAARVSGIGSSGTPSFGALTGNYSYLRAFDPVSRGLPAGGRKVLVFMSDGEPSDACQSSPAACWGAAADGRLDGITTYAILFANASTTPALRTFMAQLAENGGSAANPNCDPASSLPSSYCHFEVDTASGNSQTIATEFAAALEKARSGIDPCVLAIEKTNGSAFDPALVNVTVSGGNGQKTGVVNDSVNGWSFDDPSNPTQVILHGDACAAVKADQHASVELILGCPTVSK